MCETKFDLVNLCCYLGDQNGLGFKEKHRKNINHHSYMRN